MVPLARGGGGRIKPGLDKCSLVLTPFAGHAVLRRIRLHLHRTAGGGSPPESGTHTASPAGQIETPLK